MSQKIQVRRGTDSARQSVTFDQGEPVWTTDTNTLYIGDGATAGGVSVGGLGDLESNILVNTTSSEITNGTALVSAVTTALASTPYGRPLSSGNRMHILLPGGIYNIGANVITLNQTGLGIVGLDVKENIIIRGAGSTPSSSVIVIGTEFTTLKNITIQSLVTGSKKHYALYITQNNNMTLDSVILRRSGAYSDDVNFSTKTIGYFSPTAGNFSTTLQNSIIEGDIGHLDNAGGMPGWSINNCIFKNYNAFEFSHLKNAKFNNCQFFGKSGFFSPSQTDWSPPAPTFINCYFSGQNMPFADMDDVFYPSSKPNNFIFQNCIFEDAYLANFSGKLIDCSLSSITAGRPVILCDGSKGANPYLYNCTVVNNSSFASCISGVSSAIITTAHCRLNKNITGSFTQPLPSGGFSIVDSNISL